MQKDYSKQILCLIAFLILAMAAGIMLSGCSTLDALVAPAPDGGPSTIDTISTIAVEGGAVATTAGFPWGLIVSSVGTGLAALSATYVKMRQAQKATEDDALQTEAVFKAVVEAIENSKSIVIKEDGTTVGDIIKKLVREHLEGRKVYSIGKAVIDNIKDAA